MAILHVEWDLRGLWSMMSHVAHLYLLALLVASIWASTKIGKVLVVSKNAGASATGSEACVSDHLFHIQQSLMFLGLLFGLVLANEVFGALRASAQSRMSLSEYPLSAALEVPTGLAFVVFTVFLFLHILLWFAKVRIRRASMAI